MSRTLSYSEINTALTCLARWDMAYSDVLAGSSLREKRIKPILSEGRAWGAAVAAWHVHVLQTTAFTEAMTALDKSLDADEKQMREHGLFAQEDRDVMQRRLMEMLIHYIDLAERLPMDEVTERKLEVTLPSRTGRRSSSRYRFIGYLDATETTAEGTMLDEFKLRGSLTDVSLITNSRQIRWYAWAYWRMTGEKPVGVWVRERLNAVPKPPRLVKSKRKVDGEYPMVPSHARDQLCTPQGYEQVCRDHEVPVDPDTLHALRQRVWQQNVPVYFRDDELELAGEELVGAAQLIAQLEQGKIPPLRHVSPMTCRSCAFNQICEHPDEQEVVDLLYERRVAKRYMNGTGADVPDTPPVEAQMTEWSSTP